MTVTTASRPRLSNSRSLQSAAAQAWVRPTAWLTMPDVTGLQRFVGLHKIDADGNLVALTATGAYTVDWGDGTTTSHASGATAQKTYGYTTISSVGESTLGYRQVLIQVYPQSGQNLFSLNIAVRHSATTINYTPGWLDCVVNASNITNLNLSGGSFSSRYLQRATILSHNLTSLQTLLAGASSIQSVNISSTAGVTNFQQMFFNCIGLIQPPLLDMSSCANASQMFSQCSSLSSLPAFDLSAVSSTANMANFANACPSLASVACTGINQTVSFVNCKLSAAQIDAIFANLSSSGSGKTITVTGNYGAATCTTSIATAKGWTVAT